MMKGSIKLEMPATASSTSDSKKSADFFESEVDEAVAGIASLIEPLLLVFLASLIGGLVFALYLPIFKMGQVV